RPGLVGWTHGPGDVVPLTLRRFVAHAESPVPGGLFRPRPSGFVPGPAWPAPRLSLPRRFLAAPWPQPGGQTWFQGYRTPMVPNGIWGRNARSCPNPLAHADHPDHAD